MFPQTITMLLAWNAANCLARNPWLGGFGFGLRRLRQRCGSSAAGCRFPTAQGTHQHDELIIADGDIDAMEDLEIVEALADAGDVDAGHAALLISA
jgi:hypothetical protein